MTSKETTKQLTAMRELIAEQGARIRRYSMDPFLKIPDDPQQRDDGKELRIQLDEAWSQWRAMKVEFRAAASSPSPDAIATLEDKCDLLERQIDVIQRELISEESYTAGKKTVTWLVSVLLGLTVIYFVTHGVRTNLTQFEPWPEWGPLKYGEVAFWSAFGALCTLLFKATHYMARRDFDRWYKPWYVSTFLRAPFLAVILMMIVLEFAEWYGEGTWIEAYLMEEGVKFYFIAFLSFCLGISTDTTNGILRDLSDGVSEFISRAVSRISAKLAGAVAKES